MLQRVEETLKELLKSAEDEVQKGGGGGGGEGEGDGALGGLLEERGFTPMKEGSFRPPEPAGEPYPEPEPIPNPNP